MATIELAPATANRFVINDVDWPTYESLLELLGNRPIRLTYYRGVLEMMSPSRVHERLRHLLSLLIFTLADELGMTYDGCGSTTFKRQSEEAGLQPDECYYLEHEPLVRGKREIDLAIDPPPDLAVEIDITRSSLDRFAIYAALGVPEIWRYDGEDLSVYLLANDRRYVAAERSGCFPTLPLADLVRFLKQVDEVEMASLVRSFRAWVRETLGSR